MKMRLTALLLSFLLMFVNHTLAAPAQLQTSNTPEMKANLGVYIMEVYNLDFSRDSFNTVFWIWWVYPGDEFKPYNSFELVNALEEKVEHKFAEKIGDLNRAEAKVMARVSKDWDFVNFPFGKQTLELRFEDALLPYPELTFVPDKANSGISKKFIEGWHVTDFRIKSGVTSLDTNFGYPKSYKESKYSNITAYIDIERDSISLLLKYFIGFFVSIFLCVILYFVRTNSLEIRMAVVIASTFSAMGNKYILDRILPDQAQITFADKIQLLTFAVILFSATSSTLTEYLARKVSKASSKKVNAILGIGIALAIIFFVTLFIDNAINAHSP